MFLAEKSCPVCLCFHIPTQKMKIRILDSLLRGQWKVFIYVCRILGNTEWQMFILNVVLEEGSRLEGVTRGNSGY